jgi:hypothetical protein
MSWETVLTSSVTKVGLSVTIDALYYLARLLRHRGALSKGLRSLVAHDTVSEPSAEAQKLAEAALQAMEKENDTRVAALDETRVDRYLTRIGKLLTELSASGKAIEKDRIEKLLDEMRASSRI